MFKISPKTNVLLITCFFGVLFAVVITAEPSFAELKDNNRALTRVNEQKTTVSIDVGIEKVNLEEISNAVLMNLQLVSVSTDSEPKVEKTFSVKDPYIIDDVNMKTNNYLSSPVR